MADRASGNRRPRFHIALLMLPAFAVYTLAMTLPLIGTLKLSLYDDTDAFAGLGNFVSLFSDPYWSRQFWNALGNNIWFFAIHMLVQNPIGIALAALLSSPRLRLGAMYRTAIFIPAVLSFVIVGFVWNLLLSPLWGLARSALGTVGLGQWFQPWLGQPETALTTLGFISVWQYVGIPMMLVYAALLAIPDDVIEAAECDGITGISQFWKIKLPLVLPTIGIVSVLTFVGNFNAFDLVYVLQGAMGSPNYSTDLLGTLLYRTFFGYAMQTGDLNMGAAVATSMFLIILVVVCLYLGLVQRRLRRYEL